jgi:hypothetical protein
LDYPNQYPPLRFVPVVNLWEGLHNGCFHDWVFGVITTLGYIDESYEGVTVPDTFTLSCSLANGADWAFIETAWRWILAEKNNSPLAEGRKPLSRYHAVDCFNRKREFSDWEKEERDAFVRKLFGVFEMLTTSHITLTINGNVDRRRSTCTLLGV